MSLASAPPPARPDGAPGSQPLHAPGSQPADADPRPRPASTHAHVRVGVLDGLRGLAALLVMVAHFVPVDSPDPLTRRIATTCEIGWCGVDLFFVLSGFLITGLLVGSRRDPHYFRNFYARRTLRIFPLYYGTLIGLFVVIPAIVALAGLGPALQARLGVYYEEYRYLFDRQWAFWLYLTNVPGVVDPANFWYFLGHFWSLAVEEHFYLVWPLVVWWLDDRQLRRACVGCLLATLALRAPLAFTDARFYCYIFTPLRLDGLAIGSLLALLAREPGGLGRWVGPAHWVGGLAVIGLVIGLAPQKTYQFGTPFILSIGLTLFALAFGAALVLVTTAPAGGLLARVMGGAFLRFFGKYSYALYVFNRLLMLPCKRLFPAARLGRLLGSPLLGAAAHVVLATLVTVAFALLSWNLVEKHFLRLKSRFEAPAPSAGA